MTATHPQLRVIEGGRRTDVEVGRTRVRAGNLQACPFTPAGVVREEDTFLVLGAPPVVRPPDEHPVRLFTELHATEPLEVGQVIVRGRLPMRLLAVVVDLDAERPCEVATVQHAWGRIFEVASEQGLDTLVAPLLGTVHGRLSDEDACTALAGALRARAGSRSLEVWLSVSRRRVADVLGRLAERAG